MNDSVHLVEVRSPWTRAIPPFWLIVAGAIACGCSNPSGRTSASSPQAERSKATPLVESAARSIRDLQLDERSIPLVHPPQYTLQLLRNGIWQSRSLARDLGIPADEPIYGTLAEFEATLTGSAAEFSRAVAPLVTRAGVPAHDLATDKYYIDYERHFALPENERALYSAARTAFVALGALVGPRLERAAASYRGSEDGAVHLLESYDPGELAVAPAPGQLGFDVDVHVVESAGIPWSVLRVELLLTRALFARFGVHLRVRSARRSVSPAPGTR